MAVNAGATWDSTGATPGGVIVPRVVIFHTTASHGDSRPHSGLEWHFEVSFTGAVQQQVDTNYRADANYLANGFAISVETEGLGTDVWTDAQLDALVGLSEWCMAQHPDIARQVCDAWDGSGFGYHTMWGGGAPSEWNPTPKSCPGAARIDQFWHVLMPRIVTPQQEEEDMTPELQAAFDEIKACVKAGPFSLIDRIDWVRNDLALGLNPAGVPLYVRLDWLRQGNQAALDALRDVLLEELPEETADRVIVKLGEKLS
jgi:hypothetical protein